MNWEKKFNLFSQLRYSSLNELIKITKHQALCISQYGPTWFVMSRVCHRHMQTYSCIVIFRILLHTVPSYSLVSECEQYIDKKQWFRSFCYTLQTQQVTLKNRNGANRTALVVVGVVQSHQYCGTEVLRTQYRREMCVRLWIFGCYEHEHPQLKIVKYWCVYLLPVSICVFVLFWSSVDVDAYRSRS